MTDLHNGNGRSIVVEIADEQSVAEVDTKPLIEVVRRIVADAGYLSAEISVAIVDDVRIHDLNRRYLNHDYPTDVLSFVLGDADGHLDGQIVASVETAERNSTEYGQSFQDEMLLYAIHGALHLVGYDDASEADAMEMRLAETRYIDWMN